MAPKTARPIASGGRPNPLHARWRKRQPIVAGPAPGWTDAGIHSYLAERAVIADAEAASVWATLQVAPRCEREDCNSRDDNDSAVAVAAEVAAAEKTFLFPTGWRMMDYVQFWTYMTIVLRQPPSKVDPDWKLYTSLHFHAMHHGKLVVAIPDLGGSRAARAALGFRWESQHELIQHES